MADLTLTLRGQNGTCAGGRLNSHIVLAQTTLTIELEQHGPILGNVPEYVAIHEVIERPFAFLFGKGLVLRDTLRLEPFIGSSRVVATTGPFFAPAGGVDSDPIRLRCTLVGREDVAAEFVAAGSSAAYQVSVDQPHELSGKASATVGGVEGTVDLRSSAGSSVEIRTVVRTALDPEFQFSALVPGGSDDLAEVLYTRLRRLAERLDVDPAAAAGAFTRQMGQYLRPQAAREVDLQITPRSMFLGEGDEGRVSVSIRATRSSMTPFLVAIRVHEVDQALSVIGALTLVNRVEGHRERVRRLADGRSTRLSGQQQRVP